MSLDEFISERKRFIKAVADAASPDAPQPTQSKPKGADKESPVNFEMAMANALSNPQHLADELIRHTGAKVKAKELMQGFPKIWQKQQQMDPTTGQPIEGPLTLNVEAAKELIELYKNHDPMMGHPPFNEMALDIYKKLIAQKQAQTDPNVEPPRNDGHVQLVNQHFQQHLAQSDDLRAAIHGLGRLGLKPPELHAALHHGLKDHESKGMQKADGAYTPPGEAAAAASGGAPKGPGMLSKLWELIRHALKGGAAAIGTKGGGGKKPVVFGQSDPNFGYFYGGKGNPAFGQPPVTGSSEKPDEGAAAAGADDGGQPPAAPPAEPKKPTPFNIPDSIPSDKHASILNDFLSKEAQQGRYLENPAMREHIQTKHGITPPAAPEGYAGGHDEAIVNNLDLHVKQMNQAPGEPQQSSDAGQTPPPTENPNSLLQTPEESSQPQEPAKDEPMPPTQGEEPESTPEANETTPTPAAAVVENLGQGMSDEDKAAGQAAADRIAQKQNPDPAPAEANEPEQEGDDIELPPPELVHHFLSSAHTPEELTEMEQSGLGDSLKQHIGEVTGVTDPAHIEEGLQRFKTQGPHPNAEYQSDDELENEMDEEPEAEEHWIPVLKGDDEEAHHHAAELALREMLGSKQNAPEATQAPAETPQATAETPSTPQAPAAPQKEAAPEVPDDPNYHPVIGSRRETERLAAEYMNSGKESILKTKLSQMNGERGNLVVGPDENRGLMAAVHLAAEQAGHKVTGYSQNEKGHWVMGYAKGTKQAENTELPAHHNSYRDFAQTPDPVQFMNLVREKREKAKPNSAVARTYDMILDPSSSVGHHVKVVHDHMANNFTGANWFTHGIPQAKTDPNLWHSYRHYAATVDRMSMGPSKFIGASDPMTSVSNHMKRLESNSHKLNGRTPVAHQVFHVHADKKPEAPKAETAGESAQMKQQTPMPVAKFDLGDRLVKMLEARQRLYD